MRISICTKALLSAGILVLTTAGICLWTVVKASRETMQEHEFVDLKDETLLKGREILECVQALRVDVLAAAQSPDVEAFAAGPGEAEAARAAFQTRIDGVSKRKSLPAEYELHYVRGSLLSPEGEVLLQHPRGDAPEAKTVAGEPYFQEVRKYFADAARSGHSVYLSDVALAAADVPAGANVVRAVAPVYGSGGAIAGYATLDLNFSRIKQRLNLSTRHLVFLANDRGELLLSPRPENDIDPSQPDKKPRSIIEELSGGKTDSVFADKYTTRMQNNNDDATIPAVISKVQLPAYEFEVVEIKAPLKDEPKLHDLLETLAGAKRVRFPETEHFSVLPDRETLVTQISTTDPSPESLKGLAKVQEELKKAIPSAEMSPARATNLNMFEVVEIKAPLKDEQTLRELLETLAGAKRVRFPETERFSVLPDRKTLVTQISTTDPSPESLEGLAKVQEELKKAIPSAKLSQARATNFHMSIVRVPFDPERPERYLGLSMAFGVEEVVLDIEQALTSAMWSMLFLCLGVMVIAGLASFHFTRPLMALTQAARHIDDGDYDTPMPLARRDEVGVLTKAFAHMVNRVREREAELRAMNEALETRVKERTEELRVARDQALAAARATDAFLAQVNHEIRTPLNHIGGFAQLLELTDLDEAQREDVGKIRSAVSHLLQVINDILDVQKIKMGVLAVDAEFFDAHRLVREVAESMQGQARSKNNRIVLDGIEDLGTVRTDPQRLRQILINLISNACKFTQNGTITVARAREDSDEVLAISVTDTGVGMSPSQLSQLFQPFIRIADRAINPDGTGLGLVISKRLAERMGGDVTVCSEPGVGSTFTVMVLRDLPSPEDPAVKGLVKASESSLVLTKAFQKRPADGDTRAKRLLVIDDDPQVSEIFSRFLEDVDNLQILSAQSGAEGLELAKSEHPDLITLDVVMPGINGWSVLAALKTDEETADIPVVLVTILDEERRGYALGAADYVTKPIDRDRLLSVLKRFCERPAAKVLIVDDNPRDREVTRRILTSGGWHADEAANGAEALERLQAEPPDLILLDLMMPVMDGFEFVEELRRRGIGAGIPVIVMTAMNPTPDDLERLNGHVERVLHKGAIDQDQLREEIYRILDKAAQEAAGRKEQEVGQNTRD